MSKPPTVLFIAHNHPDLHPGGTEIFSHGLFHELKAQHRVEAHFLACVNTIHRGRLPGTLLQAAGRAADEFLLWTGHFDPFMLSQIDLHGVVPELERLLLTVRPDVVHFHHMLLVGVEAFQLVRRVLPQAAIVLTLHDYYPLCANDGQMVTTGERQLCHQSSADSCASCFPQSRRDRFVMRELFIKQAFSHIDHFISPSTFLRQRYIEWGLPPDRITVVRNGIRSAATVPHRPLGLDGKRNRFAYFGHLNPFKGTLVAIEAARRLEARPDLPFALAIHGSANFQTDEFKAQIAKALADTRSVTAHGRYARDEMSTLMREVDWVVMPSIWWENAPLVIQEAFRHGRPVICSDIGGMAEAVRDGVDGLLFRAGDPAHLAQRMEEATDPALWTRLASGITPPRSMTEAAADHMAFYGKLIAERASVAALPAGAPQGDGQPVSLVA